MLQQVVLVRGHEQTEQTRPAFGKVRMMEQVVRIEMFKNRVEKRFGVALDFATVAREWIRRYSAAFARHYDE